MYYNNRKTEPVVKIINSSLIDMPAPLNISTWWNFGSLLGMILMIQIITGLFLAMHYSGHVTLAFENLTYICRDVNSGWFMRSLHANSASLFFICIYMHIGRGMYFNSYTLIHTWMIGVSILLTLMATAFLGYVLPWGQMSLWGASVITNLLSAIPYMGDFLVKWLWGGFAVDTPTLTRFFALHFMLPFLILALVMLHILYLHQTGSNNPLGIKSKLMKMMFHPYFTLKDLTGMVFLMMLLLMVSLNMPYKLGDPENFNLANPLISPPHIQPEWYYLFAYAILRSIPNKLGGVIALILSVMIFYTLPMFPYKNFQSSHFYILNQMNLWVFFSVIFLLTWIGAKPVEDPYIFTSQILALLYFFFFVSNPLISILWDKIMFKKSPSKLD